MKSEQPLSVRCPNCKKVNEPNYNETTRRYTCPICAAPVDAQVLIARKKGGASEKGGRTNLKF